jgi:hypothetical protein
MEILPKLPRSTAAVAQWPTSDAANPGVGNVKLQRI